MAKAIMIQGTMSDAGKSLLCTGLCRVFYQDGYRVAPFKSQNMAPNSYITSEGLEMGRAQAVQAEAAGVAPSVLMNPILLKPSTDMGSQVIVNGHDRGHFNARDYYAMKNTLTGDVKSAYEQLAGEYDIIVIEGAGSPAEINLKADDFVNMGMAKIAKAPVILVGDIDRGGVFAQLYGTIALLDLDEQAMVKATVINKFRGDPTLFEEGIGMIRELTLKPVAGVLPYLKVDIQEEDSLGEKSGHSLGEGLLDIAVIGLPRISNFTDVAPLEAMAGIDVRFAGKAEELGTPDLIILPGTKNPVSDLKWLSDTRLNQAIIKLAQAGVPILGIGGGFQLLGSQIQDIESNEIIQGLELLAVDTIVTKNKLPRQIAGEFLKVHGSFQALKGVSVTGYENHKGSTTLRQDAKPFIQLKDGTMDGCQMGNVYGTNLHGLFDSASCREAILLALSCRKGVTLPDLSFDWQSYRETQYNLLADAIRASLNMKLIYDILNAGI